MAGGEGSFRGGEGSFRSPSNFDGTPTSKRPSRNKGILTALCGEPPLAPGMGARVQASRKPRTRLLEDDGSEPGSGGKSPYERVVR